MVVPSCAVLLVLAATPRGPADPLAEAQRLFNERGQQAAAEHAAASAARTDLPRRDRLELALFASNTYATMYQLFPDDPPGDPLYLCKALALLDVAAELALEPAEQERRDKHRQIRQATLEQHHPDLRCPEPDDQGSGRRDDLLPVPRRRGAPPPDKEPPVRVEPAPAPVADRPAPPARLVAIPSPAALRLRRRATALTALGGASLGLGVASLAAMSGALVIRSASRDRVESFAPSTPTDLSPEQSAVVEDHQRRYERAENIAIATGIVGSVMLLTGITSVTSGVMLRDRMRLEPELGAGRAALVLSGRF